MNSSYKPTSSLFWNRLLLLFIFILGSYLGLKFLPKYFHILYFIDPSLVFSVVLIGGIILWFLFFRTIESPLFMSVIPLMFLFWLILDKFMSKFAVSIKPHYFALAFILLGGAVILYKNFKYLWNFQITKFFLIFALINVIYYFFYSSNFNISAEGLPYGWQEGSHGQDAKTIVFLDSIASLFAFCVPAALFSKIKTMEEFKFYINKIGNILFVAFIIYFLLFPITMYCLPKGKHIFLCLNFFFILGLKFFIDNNFQKSNLYNALFSIILVAISFLFIDNANKSALVGFLGAFMLFIFINAVYLKLNFNFLKIQRQKFLVPLIILILLIVLYILAAELGFIDIISTKIHNVIRSFSGHSGISSWYIRQSNWKYFILNWVNHLDLSSLLFGFGLGASRETIFYISTTQYSKISLVQTTHNQYTEMFYDYGLVALLFYIPIFTLFFRNLIDIFSKNIDKLIKLFSTVSLCMISFFFIYHFTDGLRFETTVVFFSFLAFNEMAKHTLERIQSKDSNSL